MKFNFYPRPPRGGRRKAIPCWQSRSRFLSTPSARRATRRSWQGVQLRSISIHALREEGDDKHALVIKLLKIFLSTPSARRATRREVALNVRKKISIHALREEGDNNFINHCTAPFNFYPRPPRGGRPFPNRWKISTHLFLSTPSARRATMVTVAAKSGLLIFLSTPSARRATACTTASTRPSTDFYPRPPRGGRRGRRSRRSPHREISIHALREEGDALRVSSNTASKYFYPRPPRGGRHLVGVNLSSLQDFYPRPPRGGRPMETCQIWRPIIYFYPRPPRGGRPGTNQAICQLGYQFLSTPSARRATGVRRLDGKAHGISIHALREEGDPLSPARPGTRCNFYPRPPRGGRPPVAAATVAPNHFYPRPPRGGRPASPPGV